VAQLLNRQKGLLPAERLTDLLRAVTVERIRQTLVPDAR
jgi:hypothetical protein